MTEVAFVHSTAFIHHMAEVHGATIGARTKVWQFASVIRGTILGEDCNVAHGACLDGPKFGNRCIISHNVAMGPGFVIGDDVFIGPNATFCNDVWPSTSKEGFDVDKLRNGFVTIRVGNRAIIGANAVILPGVVIGDDAVVAAGARCSKNVPDGMLLAGDCSLQPVPLHRRRMREARL